MALNLLNHEKSYFFLILNIISTEYKSYKKLERKKREKK